MTTQAISNRYYLPQGFSPERERRLRQRNVCAECGEFLSVWMERPGLFYLACHRHNINKHEGIAKQFSPPSEQETLARREGMSDQNIQQHRELAVKGVPLTGRLTQEQATKVLKTIWKDAPEIEVYKAMRLCVDFELHPLLKHVFLLKYDRYEKQPDGSKKKIGEDWATVLGIRAKRLIKARQGTFSYVDNTPRVMSEEEQRQIFGKVDQANVVAITRLRTKDGLQAQGYGKYPGNATPYGSDKGNSVENMAFIRSESNALDRLFPDAQLPAGVEVVDEAYMPPVQVDRVDLETGEITGDQAEELPPPPTAPQPQPKEAVKAPSPQQPPSVGTDYTAFWRVVTGEKGSTPTEVEMQLGCTVPTWLKKPENKGKGLDDILAMLPERRAI